MAQTQITARAMAKNDDERPIIIKRIKKGGGGHHGGAWKVAYADFTTAMMAFFMLLWLLNVTTEEQREGLADYFAPTTASISGSTGAGGMLGGTSLSSEQGAMASGAVVLTMPKPAQSNPSSQSKDDSTTDPADDWQKELAAREQGPYVRVIPSPGRRAQPEGWALPAMPRVAARGVAEHPVSELRYVDIDTLEPSRAKDYGKSEPVVPRDAASKATLEWEAAALAMVDKAPSFVQPMIIKNAEKAAKENGSNFVSVALMEELQAKQGGGGGGGSAPAGDSNAPKPKMAPRKQPQGSAMNSTQELAGKVVIITGGTMGIGFGMAARLAKHGAQVIITSRNSGTGAEALARLREHVGGTPDNIVYKQMDITSEPDNEATVQFAVDTFGRLDAIINNAVFPGDFQMLADESLESFEQVMSTNVTGTYLGMKHAIRQFQAQGADTGDNYSVINISSGATRDTGMRMAPYIASKLAVEGLTQAAALEYSRQGIRINTLLFGVFETEKAKQFHEAMPEFEAKNAAKHHVGRFGEPEHDAGEAATYLISERSSFVTGTTIHIDGGMCL